MSTTLAPPETRTGGAPAGMWWVAWRLHRGTILLWLAVLTVLALSYIVFRWTYTAALQRNNGCAIENPCFAAGWAYVNTWTVLRVPLLGLPVVMGVLVGGALIAQERERRTQVYALTQSVGRTRWYLIKVAVVLVPLVAGLVGLGLVEQWVQSAPGLFPGSLLRIPYFQLSGGMPAVFCLLSFGIATGVGCFFPSVVPAVAVAFVVASGVVLGLGYGLYYDLVPHERATTSAHLEADGTGSSVFLPEDALTLGSGYLTATGAVVTFPRCPELDQPNADGNPSIAVFAKAWNACAARGGITTEFQDYVAPAELARLRWTVSGISVVVALIGLGLGWWRVRRRII